MPHEGIDNQNFFGVIFTAACILLVIIGLSIAGCAHFAHKRIKAIHAKGVKNVATQVWEGPTNTPSK